MDLFDQYLVPIAQVGAAGALVGILVMLIRTVSRGDWVPRSFLDRIEENYKARLAEKDTEIAYLRGAHETSEKARELVNTSNRELVGSFRTFEHFFNSMQALAVRGGAPNVPPPSTG